MGGGNNEEDAEAWQQATTDKDTAGQESPELQSNPDLGAEQLPKGLGSKTVNYNLSNRRPLEGMGYGIYFVVLPFLA